MREFNLLIDIKKYSSPENIEFEVKESNFDSEFNEFEENNIGKLLFDCFYSDELAWTEEFIPGLYKITGIYFGNGAQVNAPSEPDEWDGWYEFSDLKIERVSQ